MTAHSPAPSGQQWVIRNGRQEATVVEIGGGLRDYRIGGRQVLDGYPVDEMCSGARGTTLAPWPNRLRDGRYTFAGETQQLALSEPRTHNAIHGLVRWRPWTLVENAGQSMQDSQGEDRLTTEVTLLPQPGYPYSLNVRNAYLLGEEGLTVTTTATNIGNQALPYGLGFHPYLTVGSEHVDDDLLTVPATHWVAVDDRGLPTGIREVQGTPYDYRVATAIGGNRIDTAFQDLLRGKDGRAVVTLGSSDGERSVSLWADAAFGWLQVFTGDSLPEGVRRRGLGVEPMTCPPDAFNSGDGLVSIEPGQQHVTTWGLTTTGF